MAEKFKKAVDLLYHNKENFLVIGLTGRTGAGCSTVANILKKEFNELDKNYEKIDGDEKGEYTYNIIEEYLREEGHWVPFEVIEGSSVILSFVFETVDPDEEKHPSNTLIKYLKKLQSTNDDNQNFFRIENEELLIESIRELDYIYNKVKNFPLEKLKEEMEVMNDDQIKEYYDLYLVQMPKYKNQFKQILENHHCSKISKDKLQTDKPMQYHLYTFLLQKFGNNIRSSGDPFVSDFNQEKLLLFAERIDLFIRLIRHKNKKKSTRICIDAIRNANESNYIKSIYRNYYLISISVEDDTRKRRLRNINAGEINNIDQIEFLGDYKAEAFFYQQNILQCFEMADIHIYNKEVELEHKFFLTQQLMRYIVLMIHPGLVTPTHVERCMQLAFNAKYNSGCLSRQVGAIVTGQDYSVKAVG